jgi:hypothetical protein
MGLEGVMAATRRASKDRGCKLKNPRFFSKQKSLHIEESYRLGATRGLAGLARPNTELFELVIKIDGQLARLVNSSSRVACQAIRYLIVSNWSSYSLLRDC